VAKQVGKQLKQLPCLTCTSRNSYATHMSCQTRKPSYIYDFLRNK